MTYEDGQRMSKNFALHLQAAGATKANVMALFIPNCIEYPMVFSGAAAVGVTVTTINPIYRVPEITKQLRLSNATYAVTTKELFPTMKAATDALESPFSWKGRIFIVGGIFRLLKLGEYLIFCLIQTLVELTTVPECQTCSPQMSVEI